jgi:hypothetical protein
MTRTVWLVQRENFDGLYVFAHESDRDAYAALFPDADTDSALVIDHITAARMVADELSDR